MNIYSSKLLIDESPLLVLPTLAKEIGLHEAIILQQLHYWIHHIGPDGRRYGKVADDTRWIRNSIPHWQESNFPFFSESQIYRTLKKLEESGLIISRDDLNQIGYDRTKWYTIDYSILRQREMDFASARDGLRASEETIPETTEETTTENLAPDNFSSAAEILGSDIIERHAGRNGKIKSPGKDDLLLASFGTPPGREFDLGHFPEEVRSIICQSCDLWNLSPPRSSKHTKYGLWIKAAREIIEACEGVDVTDCIDRAHRDWENHIRDNKGLAPWNIGGLQSLVSWIYDTAVKMREGSQDNSVRQVGGHFVFDE